MASVFTKIVHGKISAYKVAEDESHLAFLDIAPIKKGHVLVIPKKETDKIFDLSPSEFAALMSFSYQVAKVLEKVILAHRVGVAVLGFEVPHAHIHLIPIDQESDLDFSRPRISMSIEEFKQLASAIQRAFRS
ncbi:HIT family protein [Bacteroidetes bacterium endosymbiont of Geopemphigus sp.]|uniref:HIT family protein n=1 Tax=Bacteroidetes bacterium endosymbiont of Geopemphigus sp. TaxID=2047937 RepID=UPI000CD03BE4|nr:HIT family protein [Bacteroidetes bacterium endosymbiont of Geopemphigus sp.]